jgi:alkylglycerol monooxygenase
MNPIVYAIPVFFLLMGLEWWLAVRRGSATYRLGDSVTSIGLGAMSQVLGIFSKAIFLGVYVLIFENVRLTTLPADAVWVWIAAVVIYDFLYYWHHRLGHEVAVFWAAHVVHHQSEEFNLGTALRQTSSGFLLGWVFYIPMALMGFPPLVFAVAGLIDLLYQYWIHTEQIRKLGWFDRVFASPSNHRVHHAVNDVYLDKNYGGIFIVWDRLFGTFIDEDDAEPVVYGTRTPLRSYDPLWANVEVYAALARDSWRTRDWRDKLRVWIKPPGWRPADVAASDPKPPFEMAARRKFDPQVPRAVQIYGFVQFVLLIGTCTFALAVAERVDTFALVAAVAWNVLSLWSVCRLLQGHTSLLVLEAVRSALALTLLIATGQWFAATIPTVAVAGLGAMMCASVLSAVALWFARRPPLAVTP